ncbi:MAG: Gfo/Idh/MocA family oxidoreductase [Anaerolineae bacterium]|nr:Gfo/Idh/MocA family oxidoreductase [Anaerolineae bacterium]
MADETGFTTMARRRASGAKAGSEIAPELGVGMLGYAFMGKAHSNAYKTLPYMIYPPPAMPRLAAICGRDAEAVAEAAQRYGYARYHTDWQALIDDQTVDLLDNGGPNHLHAAPSMAALQAGKHVICEKPLARNAGEARAMLEVARGSGAKHMVAFNYRFVPAIRLAWELIQGGALGQIYHFRAVYLQEWLMPHQGTAFTWRSDKARAGSGAVGDLGSHIVDLAHYLVGPIKSIAAASRIFLKDRPLDGQEATAEVDTDDAFASIVEFENGALGSLEATRFAAGRKNHQAIEINAERGSLRFNLERLNELQVYWAGEEPRTTRGFHNVLVSEPYHPWWEHWWPQGHLIGWEHTFVHELAHFLDCIVNDREVGPHGATFEDGYRAAVVCDAILESARLRKHVDIIIEP